MFVDGKSFGGRWELDEKLLHINVLEGKTVYFMLKSYCSNMHNCHIRI